MMGMSRSSCFLVALALYSNLATAVEPRQSTESPKAFIDGTGLGWSALSERDFTPVNGATDTWSWKDDAVHCTGKPIGVMRTQKQYTNFELVTQWKHLEAGGNSGIFVWTPEGIFKDLKPGVLPRREFEIQVLDHGFTENYEKSTGKKSDWFTTNGDVFAVGTATMKPFPPSGPVGDRSFPRKNLSKGVGQWNHYYVRAINGEIRLWVNGEEVSGGNNCQPRTGFLCLESEGSPVDFKELRIRELP